MPPAIRPSLDAGDWTDIIVALAVSSLLSAGLIWIAVNYKETVSAPTLMLAGLLGAASGWVIGILLSPYNPDEGSAFGEMAKLIYGFLSGYVLSKFDPILTDALKSSGETQWVIGCFTLISFLTAVALTYITRRYWVWRRAG